jgi:uncharacterized protein
VSASCLYEGTIRHRRLHPRREFTHRLALAYLDLDELPELLGGRLVRRRPGLVRFRRSDYLGDPARSLASAVRDRVQEQTGARPGGPIRVLTNLRSFGQCFNPVSFYYCFEPTGESLETLVAEVTNTPWGERHAYVLPARVAPARTLEAGFAKALHVSPFMSMDHRYRIRARVPGPTLSVHIDSCREDATTFDATLRLERRELTRGSLAAATVRYPFATLRMLGLIYGHAVGLKLAGASVHPHPEAAPS